MKVPIYNPTQPLPKYQTDGSIGFDLAVDQNCEIAPQSIAYLPTGFVIAVPEGFGFFIFPRVSMHKRGLMMPNSVGVIDNDYCGKDDKISLVVMNFTSKTIKVKKGDRLAQGILIPIAKAEWIPYKPQQLSRGGFGSTGK